jgi:wobble nucleotide-excising tRNase
MIDSITIDKVATYDNTPVELTNLSQFNYLFGSNGTGKTTVSRVIADESKYPTCKVTWKSGTKLEAMVYNKDFVDRVFQYSTELPGVFTLGEKQNDTLAKITSAKKNKDELKKEIEYLYGTIKEKKDGLKVIEDDIKNKCWLQKQKHDEKLKGAFAGYRNNLEKFKNKIFEELNSNTASLQSLTDIEKKAESVFGQTPTVERQISNIDITKLIAHETNPILKKQVIGKIDVDIAAIINKLGNSDWVRKGRAFYDKNNGVCPFCQQNTATAFAKSLNEYFDETFVTDSKAIDDIFTDYATNADQLQQQLVNLIESPSKFLNVEKLKSEKELLNAKINFNKQCLERKKKETSQIVELDSLNEVLIAINNLIDSANTQIEEHNKMVKNLADERKKLTAEVWRFVLSELESDLAEFKKNKDSLEKAISSITEKIKRKKSEENKEENNIKQLEKQITSVQPTIDNINSLLASFGFHGFKLDKAGNGASYKLIRENGSDAKATLSEGEKTFVTFLYFYHLLKGSHLENGMTTDRIVVFDDPVSSLDSDILFIVSSLIKGLFDEVRDCNSHIKQLFILTHNVYFHKEVSYNTKRNNVSMNEETFWIIRKSGKSSKIDKCTTNPIKTAYELLWAEVRKPDRSNISIQNTLRRIIENYFKILGKIDFDQLCAKFEGRDKLIYKSLCSWLHDGSHYAHDDLYISTDDSAMDVYLGVFRNIFEKSGHIAHYKMMMGDDFVEEPQSEQK